jgi:hypothetical protein
MSGERPSPLWPEGLRKRHNLPPVESQQRQASASGDTFFVPKQAAGSGGKKPEELKQQPSTPDRTLSERYHRERGQSRSGIAGGEAHNETYRRLQKFFKKEMTGPSQSTPAEQQTPQRRRTQREIARLAQNPELRSLADELWGMVHTKGELTKVISESLYRYPDLPPDEALREYKDDFQGFSFA